MKSAQNFKDKNGFTLLHHASKYDNKKRILVRIFIFTPYINIPMEYINQLLFFPLSLLYWKMFLLRLGADGL